MKRIGIFLSILVMVVGLSVSAQAALRDMRDGTIYDTDTQLSWLQNANTAGPMNWTTANAWAVRPGARLTSSAPTTPVPATATVGLIIMGAAGLMLMYRRRQKRLKA